MPHRPWPETQDPKHIAARFWAKVHKQPNGCWEWQRCLNAFGYGSFRLPGTTMLAHRYSWEIHNGPIPEGMCCLHKCDNRKCVNPAHLFLGTIVDNNHDRAQKGRNGHGPQDGENNGYAKLSADDVRAARCMWQEGHCSQAEIGKLFGVTQSTISRIVRGLGWTRVSL